ncbi:MAG: glycosyltransferase [Acidobacteria bacterium]|nr:glycosyltransferase [Acidobacteriota bacterium]
MDELQILITNNTLANRAGTELYVRDLAIALLRRGHKPIAYSTQLGEVAEDLRAATIPVIDNLEALATPPDIIHGHHHLDTMTALLRFPKVPAIFVCHGWMPWEETPPRFPRIRRYVAIDYTCLDRLLYEEAIAKERTRVILNFVDMERFKPRCRLPAVPKRALILSNQASEYTYIPAVREACKRFGIRLDVVGLNAGNATAKPEDILGNYDLVFAKGRAALEALAVGAAVILCDATGAGCMVTTQELAQLRRYNLGLRTLSKPVNAEILAQEIARYDANDAAEVSQQIRAQADMEPVVDKIVSLYEEVILEHHHAGQADLNDELQAASNYLRGLGPVLKNIHQLTARIQQHELENVRFTNLQRSLGWRILNLYGPVKYRYVLPLYHRLRKLFKRTPEG